MSHLQGRSTQVRQGIQEAGPRLRRPRSSVVQARTREDGENINVDVSGHYDQCVHRPTVYYQPSSHAPIFNGRIDGSVQNHFHVSSLDGLQFLYQHAATGAMHDSEERYPPPLCHPGTRDVVVSRALAWYLDENDQKKRIMWVHAPAGYGKTAVAGTITEKLKAMTRELGFTPIGATFFFWRTSPERNSPAQLIITLAYQLARSTPELRPRVDAAIKSEPAVVKMALEYQIVKLIVEPFKALGSGYRDTMPNRLVIIDGIDECINSDRETRVERKYAEDQETVQVRVLNLIHRLQSHRLPLSFLILSRPEAWIKRHVESTPLRDVVETLDLYKVGDHLNDVARLVRAELMRIATSCGYNNVDEKWPEEDWLVWRSEGHMLYVSTIIRHIDDPFGDPRQLLRDMRDNSPITSSAISYSTPLSSLHELYLQIMRSCPERNRALMLEVLEDIMAFELEHIVFANYGCQAALGVLDRLSGRPPGTGIKALRSLYSVLHIGNAEESIGNLFTHSSFTEFLLNPHISGEFFVNINKGQERLLSNVLDCMSSITMAHVCEHPEELILVALENWCRFWEEANDGLFRESQTAHLQMINKILKLDLTACIIQSYFSFDFSGRDAEHSRLWRLFRSYNPSKFFVEPMQLDDPRSTVIQKITTHTQSSIEAAFIYFLQPVNAGLSIIPPSAIPPASFDCVLYLYEVTTQIEWRESKLVQAMQSPGPQGIDLFEAVIRGLYSACDNVQDDGYWELLRYIHDFMARDQNPILAVEDHPFCRFLERNRKYQRSG